MYTTFGCAYACLSMGIYYWQNSSNYEHPKFGRVYDIGLPSVLSVTLSISISILMGTHVFFLFTNQSSVESGALMMFNPFFEVKHQHDEPSLKEYLKMSVCSRMRQFSVNNFYQHCGTHKLYWFFPIQIPLVY